MRQRWEWLAGCALVSLVGIGWLWVRRGGPDTAWEALEMIGMLLCAGFGVGARAAGTQKKWPAGVALAGALPMAQNIVLAFPSTMELMLHTGVPYLMFLAGAIGATAAATAILVAR